jgi:hypothetical protein
MPSQEILVLAVTRMLSGVCLAGLCQEPHPSSVLRWVRPVKAYDTLLLGDISDASGRVMQMGDVALLHLLEPRPQEPHVEDWVTDWVHHRPLVVRRLEGERRAQFLATHVDRDPAQVLQEGSRSLCLVRPERVWASFRRDEPTRELKARMGFTLAGGKPHLGDAPAGLPVTDLKWRALGDRWLASETGGLALQHSELLERLGAQVIYLALGLSRGYEGKTWPLVIGVHVVPDYVQEIDYGRR